MIKIENTDLHVGDIFLPYSTEANNLGELSRLMEAVSRIFLLHPVKERDGKGGNKCEDSRKSLRLSEFLQENPHGILYKCHQTAELLGNIQENWCLTNNYEVQKWSFYDLQQCAALGKEVTKEYQRGQCEEMKKVILEVASGVSGDSSSSDLNTLSYKAFVPRVINMSPREFSLASVWCIGKIPRMALNSLKEGSNLLEFLQLSQSPQRGQSYFANNNSRYSIGTIFFRLCESTSSSSS